MAVRMSENDPPPVPVPDYRPVERFWPYVDLPEQPTDEELARLNPELAEALFGRPPLPFSVSLEFPPFDGPDAGRALELARASAEYRRDSQPERRCATAPGSIRRTRSSCAICSISSAASTHRRAGRRSAGAVRARAVAAADLVSDPVIRSASHGRTDRSPEGPVDARGGSQAARGGVQHVLRRPAAASAVGDARPRRGDDQAVGPRPHHRHRRSLPVRDAAVAIPDVGRSLGSRPARARRGTAGPFAEPRPRRRRPRRTPTAARSCTSPRSRIRCARWTRSTRSTTR